MTNEIRQDRARYAVDVYAGPEAEGPPEPWIQDLITDLLHLVDVEGGDVEATVRLALMHFNAEKAGDP